MKRVELQETLLRSLDATSCDMEGMVVDLPAVRGMIMTREQAMMLTGLLGVVIVNKG